MGLSEQSATYRFSLDSGATGRMATRGGRTPSYSTILYDASFNVRSNSTAQPETYASSLTTVKSSSPTRIINRIRWHLHELDPTWEPPVRSFDRTKTIDAMALRLDGRHGTVARLARTLLERCKALTAEINSLEAEISDKVATLAPTLLETPGCGSLTAAKILGETADVCRFRSKDAFARFNGTAPLPVWTSNHPRQRLSRTGNRQLNCALHRVALTQAHWHAEARSYLQRRKDSGDTTKEAIRVLKRRLSDVAYRALLADSNSAVTVRAKALAGPAA